MEESYVCASLEDDDVFPRALTVGECAHSLCALILKAGEEFVEVFGAEGFEKPFAANRSALLLVLWARI